MFVVRSTCGLRQRNDSLTTSLRGRSPARLACPAYPVYCYSEAHMNSLTT